MAPTENRSTERLKLEDCEGMQTGLRPCLRKEGKALESMRSSRMGRVCGPQARAGGEGCTLVQCIINMPCALGDSTEKLDAPEEQLGLSRAFCMHLIMSR